MEIIAEFEHGDADEFGLNVRCGDGEKTMIGVNRRAGTVFVDRTRSGDVGFSPHFAGRHSAQLSIGAGGRPILLHVVVDTNSVEVFADGGRVVLTDQIFPTPSSRGVSLFATGGTARSRARSLGIAAITSSIESAVDKKRDAARSAHHVDGIDHYPLVGHLRRVWP